MCAYYNENDPYAAQWLRNLIAAGHIAPGFVDERSIHDVRAEELAAYSQCHFFAGIGGWALALRLAGWGDDRPVWTGSCPCQPFSSIGEQRGFDDHRHLWPTWFGLIEKQRPGVIFGEQVDAAIRGGWLDLVQTDMERIGYSVGSADLPAAGVGAPHRRQRLWFVADSHESGDNERTPGGEQSLCDRRETARGVGDTEREGLEGLAGDGDHPGGRAFPLGSIAASGAVSGFWRDAWGVACSDGRIRPVEPGTFPLAHGVPARMGRLRAYGNAIVPQVAEALIRAYIGLGRC